MSTLYELTSDYMNLLEMMSDTEIDPTILSDTMESIEGEIEIKAENYAKVIKSLEGDIEKIKAEKNRLSDRQKSIENNIENMKSNLQKAMVLTGKTKFSTSLFNFNIAKNPPSVIIDDESKIPQEYLIPQPAKIDKTAIKNLLKNLSDNDKITFAHLEQKESLRIK